LRSATVPGAPIADRARPPPSDPPAPRDAAPPLAAAGTAAPPPSGSAASHGRLEHRAMPIDPAADVQRIDRALPRGLAELAPPIRDRQHGVGHRGGIGRNVALPVERRLDADAGV